MDLILEYWLPLVILLGAFLSSLITPMTGYLRKPKNGQHSTIQGAVMIDSGIGRDIAHALDRIAYVAEKMELHMKETADTEAEDRRIAAAVEAARVKWERENKN